MKVKDFKELINALPDNYVIGYNEEYEEGHNLNHWTSTRFEELDGVNLKIDVKNKRIVLDIK